MQDTSIDQQGVRRALTWSVSRFLATFSLELAGLAVIARLLGPAEIGIFVAAYAVIRFGQFVAGMGTHLVVIRGQTVDDLFVGQIVATLLATTTLVGVCIAALLVTNHTLLGLGGVQFLVAIMLPGLVLNSLGIPANALLTRQFRFKAIFFLHVSSSVTFQCTAILLAAMDFGASSLAYATVASTTVFVCLATLVTRGRFLRFPRLAGIGEITRFSVTVFLTTISEEVQRLVIVLLLGRLGGPSQLGLYSRADELISKLRLAVQQNGRSMQLERSKPTVPYIRASPSRHC